MSAVGVPEIHPSKLPDTDDSSSGEPNEDYKHFLNQARIDDDKQTLDFSLDSLSVITVRTEPVRHPPRSPSAFSRAPRKRRKAYPYEHSSRNASAATMPTTRKTTAKPSMLSRLRGRAGKSTTTTTTKTTKTTKGPSHRTAATTTGTHHHKRKPSMKDKVSGAMLKLKGTVTRRPGVKAAGTRRMRGTDGKGGHHVY